MSNKFINNPLKAFIKNNCSFYLIFEAISCIFIPYLTYIANLAFITIIILIAAPIPTIIYVFTFYFK